MTISVCKQLGEISGNKSYALNVVPLNFEKSSKPNLDAKGFKNYKGNL